MFEPYKGFLTEPRLNSNTIATRRAPSGKGGRRSDEKAAVYRSRASKKAETSKTFLKFPAKLEPQTQATLSVFCIHSGAPKSAC